MISVIIPSMGRSNQLNEVIASIYDNLSDPGNIELVLGVYKEDFETKAIADKWYKEKDNVLIHVFDDIDCSVVAKYNKLARMATGKYVMGLSDDTWMITKNFDQIIDNEFAKVPDGILMLVINDGPGYETLNRHLVLSKVWINTLGWIAPPDFGHYYTDNIYTEVGKQLGRTKLMPEFKLDHKHPAFNTAPADMIHVKEYNAHWDSDTKRFNNKEYMSQLINTTVDKLRSMMDEDLKVIQVPPQNPMAGISLLVGTPAYGGMVHLDYVKTLLELLSHGVSFTMYGIGNESLITRGRNTIFSYFMHNTQFSHLLFLDADVYVQGSDIKKMLLSNEPVIGAPVRLKSKAKTFNINEVKEQRADGIWTVGKLGTAVYMMNRTVCERLAQLAEQEDRIYDTRSLILGGDQQNPEHTRQWDIFRVGVVDKIYLSEDYFVADQLTKLGYKVQVDMNIYTRHNGNISVATNELTSAEEIQQVIENINHPNYAPYKEKLLEILGIKAA